MTQNEFNAECEKRTIDPEIALENENILYALLNRDDERVIKVLDTEF